MWPFKRKSHEQPNLLTLNLPRTVPGDHPATGSRVAKQTGTMAKHQQLLDAFHPESPIFQREERSWTGGRNGLALLAPKLLANNIPGGEWAVLQALKATQGDVFRQLSEMLKKYNPQITSDINLLCFCLTDDGQLAKYQVGPMREPFVGIVLAARVRLIHKLGPPHHLCAIDDGVIVVDWKATDGQTQAPKSLNELQVKALTRADVRYFGHKIHFFEREFSAGQTVGDTGIRRPTAGEQWREL